MWWELMKELRFSIQCGASNRKALISRRCSQCVTDTIEAQPATTAQAHRHSHLPSHRHSPGRRSSIGSNNVNTSLQSLRHEPKAERTSDLDKFDTLLMLAAERTSRHEARHRHSQNCSPTAVQRKPVPLLIVEQEPSNHTAQTRSQYVRFTKGISAFQPCADVTPVRFLGLPRCTCTRQFR